MPAIVVGYDDSPGSQAALEVAASLAAEHGDELIIGFGIEPPGHVGRRGQGPPRRHPRQRREGRQARGRDGARQGRRDPRGARGQAAGGRPAGAGGQHDARFIVVGTYGESPLKGAILGSTPHKLLHLSEVPVVVVPA